MNQPPPLPKRRRIREWFRASAVSVFVIILLVVPPTWQWYLKGKVNRQLAVLRAAGLPTSGSELNNWYAPVPEAEDAAPVMAEASQFLQTFPDERSNQVANFKLWSRGKPLSADDRKLLTDYVQMNAAALAKAHEAARMPNCRYPVDYAPGPLTQFRHLAPLKRLGQLAWYDATLAGDAGRTADATQSMLTILGWARTLDTEPDIFAQMLRISALVWSTDALEHGLLTGGFDENELAQLATAFAAAEKTNCIARAWVGERAMYIPVFRRISEGRGAAPEPDPEAGESEKNTPHRRTTWSDFWLGIFDRDLDFFLTAMQTNISLASESPPRSLAAESVTEQLGETAVKKSYFLSGLVLPSLGHAVVKEASGLARIRLAQIAVAVERFRLAEGRLPKDLFELVPRFLPAVPADPFDGAPLRYRLLSKGYQLYSVDRDGQDNGGRDRPRDASSSYKADYDLVFQVER